MFIDALGSHQAHVMVFICPTWLRDGTWHVIIFSRSLPQANGIEHPIEGVGEYFFLSLYGISAESGHNRALARHSQSAPHYWSERPAASTLSRPWG